MYRSNLGVPLVALVALASACALGSQRVGRVIDAHQVGRIHAGVTTKAEVLALFGPPSAYSRIPAARATGESREPARSGPFEPGDADDVFIYEYREQNEIFFSLLFFTQFRRETISDTLMVFFDAADVVQYVAFSKQTGARTPPREDR